jgi:hypothetical protein
VLDEIWVGAPFANPSALVKKIRATVIPWLASARRPGA